MVGERALKESGCLIWSSDLQEWVGLGMLGLASLAKIEVWSDATLVPDALDGISVADVANVVFVDLCLLISSSLPEVITQESLESLASVSGDLFSQNFEKL